jgi:YHS domain-containing protein
MKHLKVFNVALVVILLLVSTVWAEDTPVKSKPQTTCPIMGGEINKEVYTDYEGKRVYFCCPGCLPEFKKDPAKYIKKLEDAGVTLEKAPKAGTKDKSQGCGDCGGCSS